MSEQIMTLRTTAPSPGEVTENEATVFRFLDELGIKYGWLFHEAKGSSHYGNEIYDVLEVPLPKNLFLVNKKGKHYILMLHADKTFVSKEVAHKVDSSRMSFGSPEKLAELMNTVPGSVSPLELLFDSDNQVQLLIDSDLLKAPYVTMHAVNNTLTMRIRTEDFMNKVLPALHHEPVVIDIENQAEDITQR
jgi:Ala-tRNA(Pro) deacylase